LDLSERSASVLGFKNAGIAKVKIDVLAEPSRNVAAAAKAGRDTRGYEVALNNNKPNFVYEKPRAINEDQSIQNVALNTYGMRTHEKVTAEELHLPPGTKKIYVQAGSFAEESNALDYSKRLSAVGPTKVYLTRINTTPYFRVRLGPYKTEQEAAEVITSLYKQGNQNAVLVKE
jgi:rare lipoprotein A